MDQLSFHYSVIDRWRKWKKQQKKSNSTVQLQLKLDKTRQFIPQRHNTIKNSPQDPYIKQTQLSIKLQKLGSLKQKYKKLQPLFNKTRIDRDHNFIGKSYYKRITQQKAKDTIKQRLRRQNKQQIKRLQQVDSPQPISKSLFVQYSPLKMKVQKLKYQKLNNQRRGLQQNGKSPFLLDKTVFLERRYQKIGKYRPTEQNLRIEPWDQIDNLFQ